MKKRILVIALALLMVPCFFVLADQTGSTNSTTPSNDSNAVSLTNPLGKTATPQALIGKVIEAILGVVGSIALLMFIYGGFTWMTSGGNEKNVTKGREIVMWAAIGLIIIFTSYGLIKFVIGSIAGSANG